MLAPLFDRVLKRRVASKTEERLSEPEVRREAETQLRRGARLPGGGTAELEWLDPDQNPVRREAQVGDTSQGGFAVLLECELPLGWPVTILHREAVYHGVTRDVVKHEDGWRIGLEVVSSQSRRSERYPCNCLAEAAWSDAEHQPVRIRCLILDSSESGVQLEADEAPPSNATLCLYYGGWRRFGVVAHVTERNGRKRIGVHFSGAPIADESSDYEG